MDEDRGKVPPLVEVIRISFGDWLSLGVEVLILVGYSWLCVGTGARVVVDPQAILRRSAGIAPLMAGKANCRDT